MESIKISIGGLVSLLYGNNVNLIKLAKEKYKNFLTDKDHLLRISLRLQSKAGLSPQDYQPITPPSPAEIYPEDSGFRIRHRHFQGYINMKKLEAEVSQYFITSNFDSFVRIVYSLLLVEKGGFLLHASSIIRNGKGYIFSGKSGRGKTTLANLFSDDRVLTDEVSLIRNIKGRYRIFGTPFYGELKNGGKNTSAVIERLYILIQNEKTFQRKLLPTETLSRLMPNILFFAKDSYLVRKLISICCDFVSIINCYNLHFSLSSLNLLWRYIDGE